MSSPSAGAAETDNDTRRYTTRAPSDRARPATLAGFAVEDTPSSSARSSAPYPVSTTSSGRPKPKAARAFSSNDADNFFDMSLTSRRLSNANSAFDDSDTSDAEVQQSDASSIASSSASGRHATDPVKSSVPKRPSLSITTAKTQASTKVSRAGARSSLPNPSASSISAAKRSLKEAALGPKAAITPKITTLFASTSSSSSQQVGTGMQAPSSSRTNKNMDMPPPAIIPPKRIHTNAEGGRQPGDDQENPIVISAGVADEDTDIDHSNSSHQRKDRSPEAALKAAEKRSRLSKEANAEREKAQAAKKPWIAPKGVSAVYIYFGEPFLGTDKLGKQVVYFPCQCHDPPVNVPRPMNDSGTNALRSHAKSSGINIDHFPDPRIDEMFKAQAQAQAISRTALTPGVTRQMAVAWVTMSCRPLSIVEDGGFHAFLTEEQISMMPSHQTVSRDIAKVAKGMVQHITNELAEVEGCFHLAIDVWTSSNGYAFLRLIICYQRSGESVRRVLEMVPFLDKHDSYHLAETTHRILVKYGVGSRVWNIVSDNASENTSMKTLLAAKAGLPRFKADGDNDMSCRVRCAAHVLNLISKAILNEFSPKKKKAQSNDSSNDGTAAGENADAAREDEDSDEEHWEVENDEEDGSESESEASDNDEREKLVAVDDEDDFAVSRALNPDLDLDADDERELQSISSQTSKAVKEGIWYHECCCEPKCTRSAYA
ncbi:hypothetical protein CF327_g7193 [Tilletia walkeri]|nr:hypothetical protein CF327_g7193 [Tilletia walkeri]